MLLSCHLSISGWGSKSDSISSNRDKNSWDSFARWLYSWSIVPSHKSCNVWWIIFTLLIISCCQHRTPLTPHTVWPLTYIKRCTPIQFCDMQRSRTRFPSADTTTIWSYLGPGPYRSAIVWRLWIRIYRTHNVFAEILIHKSSYKRNIQEFSLD